MHDKKRTEVSELGEFELINRITNNIKLSNQSSLYGIGDDAAVLNYNGKQVLVTTDMLIEGVHFDLTYTPIKHLGYKSVIVNISDIFAMNGSPQQITISLAISNKISVEDIEEFYAGAILACNKYSVDIVGGDTTSSLTGLAISITCIGQADSRNIVYRNGAKPNDLICVSGNLGAAYMGLQLLKREKTVFLSTVKNQNESFSPNFSGREYILERQLKPEARGDIITDLIKAEIKPTAMIDISDGLSSELLHICSQSGTGCNVYQEKIPINFQTAVMAEELNMDVYTCALNGGEDYELLFTVPLSLHEKIEKIDDVKIIGYITKPEQGKILITQSGQEIELKAQGWQANF